MHLKLCVLLTRLHTCALPFFVIFFVFFKQKKAYVLRISDWSSDVCSSDLGCCVRANTPSPKASFSVCTRSSAPTTAWLRGLSPTTRCVRPVTKLKIGRASCRESVCQYV